MAQKSALVRERISIYNRYMNTKIEKIDELHIDQTAMREAAKILRSGGLVAFPTETVYGLGADALQPEASKKIYAAKGRPSDNPLIVHIASLDALEKIAAEIPPAARLLAERYWPGPLTMIFKKKDIVPLETTGGLDTVAVRFPSHPVARTLIEAAGGYIAAPSANTSGRPSPTLASHVYEDMNGRIPLILDGGEVGIGIESTIIDLSGETPMILRPGYITGAMLQQVIGEVADDPALCETAEHVRPKAPGMKYRHYAPKAPLILVEGAQKAVVDTIRRQIRQQQEKGVRVGVIAADETADLYPADVVKNIGSRQDEAAIAKHLYRILREFDGENVGMIYSESFDTAGFGQAIMNRLLKAAGHQKIRAEEN